MRICDSLTVYAATYRFIHPIMRSSVTVNTHLTHVPWTWISSGHQIFRHGRLNFFHVKLCSPRMSRLVGEH
uniref:Uncharacterized protein n=1 Tax=Aegilops tauschii subsp. strangulata TaxID=200361 RepID=A0A453GDU7_AEGTS